MSRFLITGCSSGIGLALSYRLDGDVYGICRSKPAGHVFWIQKDLVNVIHSWHIPYVMDYVILNAAVMDRGFKQRCMYSRALPSFLINCWHQAILVEQLHNNGKLAHACKVLVISSFLEHGSAMYPVYGMSKAALGCWARSLAMEWRKSHPERRVGIVYPGRVDTPSNPKREVAENEVPFKSVERAADQIVDLLLSDFESCETIDLGRVV